jgi:hypothetical protein
MATLAHLNKSWHKMRWPLAVAAVSFLWTAPLQIRAMAEDDVFQLAVNYLFTGRTDPQTLLKLSIASHAQLWCSILNYKHTSDII